MERNYRVVGSRGFTLIETIVVVSIVFLLLCLLMPGVQSARETARRVRCSNNLKQLGISILNYHDSFGSLPPGRMKSYDPRFSGPRPTCTSTIVDKSFEIFILAFVEQNGVYDAINQSLTIIGAENSTVHSIAVPVFACPSDSMAGWPRNLDPGALTQYGVPNPARMVFTSYAGMVGSLLVFAQPVPGSNCFVARSLVSQCNGVFNDVSPIRLSSVTDGLSNTIFAVEKATAILNELAPINTSFPLQHGWYITGNWGDTLVSSLYPPNAYSRVSFGAMETWANSASSLHSGGINALMGDGTVRFVKDTIQTWPFDITSGTPTGASRDFQGAWVNLPRPGVWQSLSTRSASEILSHDAY